MNKYEELYQRAAAQDSRANWIGTAITALAMDIEKRTGQQVKVSGPFGLRAEVMLCTEDKIIVITPWFMESQLHLHYDTGQMKNEYAPNTLGDYNGMNNITAPLPDTVEEIIAVMHRRKRLEEQPI